MNVAPQAVFQTLKAMCAGQRIVETLGSTESSAASQSTSVAAAPTEPKGQWTQHANKWYISYRPKSWSRAWMTALSDGLFVNYQQSSTMIRN